MRLPTAVLALAMSLSSAATADPAAALDRLAPEYVRLVLAIGRHHDGYIDAYYGPAAWREEAEATPRSLEELGAWATRLAGDLGAVPQPADAAVRARRDFLVGQLAAARNMIDFLAGVRWPFAEEAERLYQVRPPRHGEAYFRDAIARLDRLLPGRGDVAVRYARWREAFTIPPERVDVVFRSAIAEARARTQRRSALPDGEAFMLEYVQDKPWSGYNWYRGGAQSLIQINTSLPIAVSRALDLAAHEGYPGHHVYNALLEQRLVRERGWIELAVYPLFSPQSLIAEGTANYGIELAFPGAERVAFERDVLFPLAGIDPGRAAEHVAVLEVVSALSYASNEAARRLLDGETDEAGAQDFLERFGLETPERAAQRVRFIRAYRSYVINYNLGLDLVRAYVEREAGADPEARWRVFLDLLASPRLPGALR